MSINQNNIIMKIKPVKNKLPLLTVSYLAAQLFLINACTGEKPAYVKTSDRLYEGSIYYVQAECTTCHGGDWDGNGPETKNMKAVGLNPSSFAGEVPSGKTPVDYFMALTDPKTHFASLKGKVAEADLNRFVTMHSYHSMTDRARWSIAHFLFSKHSGDAYSKNKSAINEKMKEVEKVYSENRRWEVGYTPIAQRSTVPSLDEMISKSNLNIETESSMPSVSDERIKNANMTPGVGQNLYRTNCQSCHGKFAEGMVEGNRIGLLNGGPAMENDKGISRRSMTFISVKDLAFSPAMANEKAFQNAHESTSNMINPSIESLTDSEWQELFNYTKGLTGR